MGRGGRSVLVTLTALGLLASGCAADGPTASQGSGTASHSPATSSPATTTSRSTSSLPATGVHPTCVEPDEQAGATRFRNSAGARLVGVMLGEGRTGIVLGHQLGGDLCEWMPMARDLADRGYRVLAIDFGGFGESESADDRRTLREDILAATTQLRRAGSDRVVLIGSSMGGTAVVAAAPDARVRVSAVVSLSGPAQFAGLDAAAAARKLTAPAYFAAGDLDGSFPDSAREMYRAAGSTIRELKIYPVANHGTRLTSDPESLADLLEFLDRVAPPR